MISLGIASGTNYNLAFSWYRKAAEAGNPNAMAYLGSAYLYGMGVDTDYQQALAWYRKAADAGNAAAMAGIGVVYESGYGVSKDQKQAIACIARPLNLDIYPRETLSNAWAKARNDLSPFGKWTNPLRCSALCPEVLGQEAMALMTG